MAALCSLFLWFPNRVACSASARDGEWCALGLKLGAPCTETSVVGLFTPRKNLFGISPDNDSRQITDARRKLEAFAISHSFAGLGSTV